jgi:hypothetical protein
LYVSAWSARSEVTEIGQARCTILDVSGNHVDPFQSPVGLIVEICVDVARLIADGEAYVMEMGKTEEAR